MQFFTFNIMKRIVTPYVVTRNLSFDTRCLQYLQQYFCVSHCVPNARKFTSKGKLIIAISLDEKTSNIQFEFTLDRISSRKFSTICDFSFTFFRKFHFEPFILNFSLVRMLLRMSLYSLLFNQKLFPTIHTNYSQTSLFVHHNSFITLSLILERERQIVDLIKSSLP